MEVVNSINPSDILFGRGHKTNIHPGNALYRKIINERKKEYNTTKHRQTKSKIAKEVVASVRKTYRQSPRFLRKATAKESHMLGIDNDVWCTVDEQSILDKTKQALRREGMKKDETPFDNQSPSSDKHDSESTALLLDKEKAAESPEVLIQVNQGHAQEGNIPFVDQDHRSDNPTLTSSIATQLPSEKDAIQSREANSQMDIPFGTGQHTSNPEKYFTRPYPVRTLQGDNQDLLQQVHSPSPTTLAEGEVVATVPPVDRLMIFPDIDFQDTSFDNQDPSIDGKEVATPPKPEAEQHLVTDEEEGNFLPLPVLPGICFHKTHPPKAATNDDQMDMELVDW